jgi:hypothetical protein
MGSPLCATSAPGLTAWAHPAARTSAPGLDASAGRYDAKTGSVINPGKSNIVTLKVARLLRCSFVSSLPCLLACFFACLFACVGLVYLFGCFFVRVSIGVSAFALPLASFATLLVCTCLCARERAAADAAQVVCLFVCLFVSSLVLIFVCFYVSLCVSLSVCLHLRSPPFARFAVFVCLRAQPPTRLTWQLDNDVLEMANEALACAEGEIENLDLMVGTPWRTRVPRGVPEYPVAYPSTPWNTGGVHLESTLSTRRVPNKQSGRPNSLRLCAHARTLTLMPTHPCARTHASTHTHAR